jgi:hypothetical protein
LISSGTKQTVISLKKIDANVLTPGISGGLRISQVFAARIEYWFS